MQQPERVPSSGKRKRFAWIVLGVCAAASLLAGCPPPPQSGKPTLPANAPKGTTTKDSMVKLRESAEGLGAAIAAHNQPVASYHLKHLELTLQALRQEHGAMGALAQEKLGASMSALRVALEDAEWPDVEQKHESLIASCTSCHPPPWRDGIAPVGSASALGLARSRLRLGVLAAEGEQATRERWEPLAEYLAATLQVGVELVPLGFDAVGPALAQSRLDFLLTNPASFARYRERYGLRLLTTLLSRREGEGYALFGGLLVMREDEVRALKDLKGLRLAAVDPGSLGGWRLQRAELLAAGVDPERDLEVSFHSTHDAVLLAVQDGEADVGAVRTGTLSDMIARGKLAPGGLRVLGGERNLYTEGLSGKDFPFPLSTRLVPQWPLCANPDVPEELSLEVAKALLNLRHTDPACRAAKIQGFGLPRDYSLVQQLVAEQDGVGPAPTGWRSAARALRPPLVLDGMLLIALGLAIVGLLRRGTALRAQRDAALGELERDPLTGLLTARSLAREFARVRSSGQPGQELALLHVDLDGFRETCTTFGSEVAEAVLRHVAGRLAEAAPQTSLHRLRGDELILLTSAKPAEVESLVERLLEEIARPIRLGERLVVQKATVGVALAPLEDARLPSLLDRAGAAMARAKLTHRGAFLIAGEGSPSDPEGETGTGIDDEPLRFMRSRQSTPTKLPSGNTLMVKAPPPDPDLSTSLGGPTEVMDLSEGEAQE